MDPLESSSMPRVSCRNSVNSENENADMEIIYIHSLQHNITFWSTAQSWAKTVLSFWWYMGWTTDRLVLTWGLLVCPLLLVSFLPFSSSYTCSTYQASPFLDCVSYVAQAGLKRMVFLLQPTVCYN